MILSPRCQGEIIPAERPDGSPIDLDAMASLRGDFFLVGGVAVATCKPGMGTRSEHHCPQKEASRGDR